MSEQPSRRFQQIYSRRGLQSLCTGRSFERGRTYALDGHVHRLHVADDQVTATVHGTTTYQVCLWAEHEAAAWRCTCPWAWTTSCASTL